MKDAHLKQQNVKTSEESFPSIQVKNTGSEDS